MQNFITIIAMAIVIGTESLAHAAPAEKMVTIVTSPNPQTQLKATVLTFQRAHANTVDLISIRRCSFDGHLCDQLLSTLLFSHVSDITL